MINDVNELMSLEKAIGLKMEGHGLSSQAK
jgi:hypothetical protein